MAVRNFDSLIVQNFKTQAADTFPVKMIEIEKIKPHDENFYSLSDIELLAEDIDRQGLKHNLVVYEDENEKDKYKIISGHRRFAAVSFLIFEGKWKSKYLPCCVTALKSEAETLLNLIMLNATARVLSDGELISQYEKLEKIIKEDKELSSANGRIREKIASVLKVSSAQVGKMENIKRNALEEIKQAVKTGDISISTANEFAKLDETEQRELIKDVDVSKISNKMVKEKQSQTKKKIKELPQELNENGIENNEDDTDFENEECEDEKDNEDESTQNYLSCDSEIGNENIKISSETYSELIKALSNDGKRRAFTDNYKEWGIWFEVKELFQKYYKYDLPDETRIVVIEYKTENYYPRGNEPKYNVSVLTYIQKDLNCFKPSAVSDFELSDYLKSVKEKLSQI